MRKPPYSILADIQDAIEQAKLGKLALYWQRTIQREYSGKKVTPAEQQAYEQLQSVLSEVPQWKRCPIGLPGSSNPIRRKTSRTSRLRPIIMWTKRFFKLPLQHGEIYGIAVPHSAN